MTEKKWVYLFSEVDQAEAYCGGDWDKVRGLLGGKGANLADMARIGVPVPPGFTVTTEACNYYSAHGKFPEGLWEQMLAALAEVEKAAGVCATGYHSAEVPSLSRQGGCGTILLQDATS